MFDNKGRGIWNSQIGFLAAAVGSAIGLGNIWRFSYMAYDNGGGAFLVPYIFALLTAGIPLLLLEFAIGHNNRGSAPLAYFKVDKKWEWLGWWSVLFVMFGIELYYVVIISWCFDYMLFSVNLSWGEDPNSFFFKNFLGLSDGPLNISSLKGTILSSTVVIWGISWFIVYRGINKGVELANKIFMPLLFLMTAVLVFWSITLEGAGAGISAYLTPDFSKITSPKVWIDSYSQIFFTLSLGFGIMIAYASYLPENSNITRGAIITAVINSGYSLFAGFAVFAVLGFMATTSGKEISAVVGQSIGLAFVAYPKALSTMPGGNIFGFVFFLCLFIAGVTSSISIIEAFTSAAIDKFGYSRKRFVSILAIVGFAGSIIFTSNAGLYWLDIVDHFLTHYGLITVGILECILVGWLYKDLSKLKESLNQITFIKLGSIWVFFVRFFAPAVLLIVLISSFIQELEKPYEGYPIGALIGLGVSWLVLTLTAAFILTVKKWSKGF